MQNKDVDKLRSNCAADRRLCFRCIDSVIPSLSKSEIGIFCGCTARFVPNLVGNTKDKFRRDATYILIVL